MRHRKSGRKLGRNASHRRAMFSNLVTSLFRYERIQTTDAKAKELRRIADKLITLGKRGDLHARRIALRQVRDKEVLSKLFDDLAERNKERAGGYTRILKVGRRSGDNASISIIELVERDEDETTGSTASEETAADETAADETAADETAADETDD